MYENDITNCVNDFNQFIEFNKNEHPILSVKLGLLGKKDSFKLNSLLINQKNVTAPNYLQDQYPVIDLMFELALLGKLYYKGNDGKGNPALVKTPMVDSYLALNEVEKYVFLLQTYWTKYEFLEKFDRGISISAFYNFLVNIAISEPNQEIFKEEKHQTYRMYSVGAAFQHHLRFFCMGEPESIEGAKGKYEDTIRAFVPNRLGIKIAEFLCTEALVYWNRKDLVYLENKALKKKKKKSEPFDVFKQIFPQNIVVKTVEQVRLGDFNGVYCFKVSLSKTLWRKIKLSGKHTLGNLHDAIQEAFEFDDDHLYAFYIGGNRRTGKPIYCQEAQDIGPVAEKIIIMEMGLFVGQKLTYLFDFGDMWEFSVDLIGIEKEEPLPLKPIIVEAKGKSPVQYRSDW